MQEEQSDERVSAEGHGGGVDSVVSEVQDQEKDVEEGDTPIETRGIVECPVKFQDFSSIIFYWKTEDLSDLAVILKVKQKGCVRKLKSCTRDERPVDLYFRHLMITEWIESSISPFGNEAELERFIRGIMGAVQCLHDHGFLHRDIGFDPLCYH